MAIKKGQFEPEDYCIIEAAPDRRLSAFERSTLTGGAELERALMWIARQFDSLHQIELGAVSAQEIERAIAHYSKWQAAPDSFFELSEKMPILCETVVHGLKDGSVVDLEFVSGYQPRMDTLTLSLTDVPNSIVQVRWWRHSGAPRPTLIGIHGWQMGDQRLNALAFLPGHLYRLGLDVALIELPFHGRRRPAGFSPHRSLFPSAEVALTNEAIAQAIHDLRALKQWLLARGVPTVGCSGISLGAYVSALWAALDRLSFCIAFVPLAQMDSLAWRILQADPNFSRYVAEGLSEELLHAAFSLHAPLTRSSKLAPARALIFAAEDDAFVPATQARALADHWEGSRLHWVRGGHAAQFRNLEILKEVEAFLGDLTLAVV